MPCGRRHKTDRVAAISLLLLTSLLAACASPATVVRREPAPPPPSTEVYFYPTRGQSPAQQERDRYECYRWAVKQTGFDPSGPQLAPHQRVAVVPVRPPGQDIAVGAVTGAAIGAIVSPPREAAEGAVAGAIAGAIVGAASEAARQEEAERLQRQYDRRAARYDARLEQQARHYRRAMAACLEGRGYSVAE